MLQGTHTRETRDGAREVKFLVAADRAARVLDWARSRLQPDPHAGGPDGDEYRTTTIYFDTHDLAVYNRRGSFARSKYRIRRYGRSETAFLERKLRTKRLLNKRRSAIACTSLPGLTWPEFEGGDAYHWFVARLHARRLAPVAQVGYRRHALVGMATYGPLRLTFDDQITAQPNGTTIFAPDSGVPVLDGQVIIEMKFCLEAPAVLKRLVEEFGLSPAALSKYRTSLGSLQAQGPAVASDTPPHTLSLAADEAGHSGFASA